MHRNLVHVDDVEAVSLGPEPFAGRRQRLGAAGGAARIGVSRFVLGPREQPMPAHVHADEEEHLYVVAGDGLVWCDGRAWRIAAGEVAVHPARGPAHAFAAGEHGAEALVFATGSATGTTWLPRSGSWWMGPRWLPSDGPDPRALEAALGPLEWPQAEPGPAPFVAGPREELAGRTDREGYRERWWRLSDGAGGREAGLGLGVLEPGCMPCPPHVHSMEEECFYVLAGEGEALIDLEPHPVGPGSVLVCPPGGISHTLRAGSGPLAYLVYGTRVPGDWAWFPRSRKLSLRNGVVLRVEEAEYFEGEEP